MNYFSSVEPLHVSWMNASPHHVDGGDEMKGLNLTFYFILIIVKRRISSYLIFKGLLHYEKGL